MPKLLNVIVACAENRVIGRDGRLPWKIPEDLKFFHDQTAGQICILGRVCFETWPRAQKDGRRPIVVTSRSLAQLKPTPAKPTETPGAMMAPTLVPSLPAALAVAETLPGEIYICGGQRIYEETLALVDRPLRLHLTLIHADVPGDTSFPEWRQFTWRELSRRESMDATWRYTFLTLERDPVRPLRSPLGNGLV